ncbi:hypothetical protein GCM10023172_22150 [Hymenobacter ginsengisoli]|uniref:MotA/TolQ/ExbB proton channel domain-containing protein n=1 Tax=Hymenobacter ginsengisoli TaxID=1051626 RepID=A0ABP8QGG2_9BACT|nr:MULTISPECIES: hypothetical protein [unclassified Hymenobacter]MBO2032020.1 hypothetical protein [Hymenobacter sp. BT559]
MEALEWLALLIVIGFQARAFWQSRGASAQLAALFPASSALRLARHLDEVSGQQVDVLLASGTTPDFEAVVQDTNAYLLKNKGTADFDILQSIAERRAVALDAEVQSSTSSPLYIGLMGTFLGAILGLAGLLGGSGRFDEAGIQGFLRGVTVAMIGSLCGLGLTLWGSALYRTAHRQAEQRRNDYYTFLQVQLLPILHSDMAGSLGSLKAVLDAFNQEFLSKIYEFGPIVQALNENISTQKDFLEQLQKVGYTQMADASIRVFDKVAQSAHHFENFLAYQQELNQMLQNGGEVASKITSLLGRLTGLEAGLNQVPALVQQHAGTVQAQLNFFRQNQTELDRLARQSEVFMDTQYHELAGVMRQRMTVLKQEADEAARVLEDHFQALNKDNVYERIVEYLSPFSELPAQQRALNQLQERQSQQTALALHNLQDRLASDTALQQQLLQQITRTNVVLEQLTQRSWLQKALGLNRK